MKDNDTGESRAGPNSAHRARVGEAAAPEAHAALCSLLADLSACPERARPVQSDVLGSEYQRVQNILQQAQDRGEIRADIDLRLTIDTIVDTARAQTLLFGATADRNVNTALVDLFIRGMAPRS